MIPNSRTEELQEARLHLTNAVEDALACDGTSPPSSAAPEEVTSVEEVRE
jgi:hypothetical protein